MEIRIDAINVLTQLKRPLSKRAQDIGDYRSSKLIKRFNAKF